MSLPKHVGIILDGNGRWATARGLERTEGHKEGVKNVISISRAAADAGVKVLSLYAFSTENWKRPAKEVGVLMRLLVEFLNAYLDEFMQRKVQLRVMGDLQRLPITSRKAMEMAIARTRRNQELIMNIGINYGGHDEIVRAVRRMIQEGVLLEQIDEKLVADHLDTAGLPPMDLLIRTGGEKRLSNFMLWQAAYSELFFTDTLWPDFTRAELEEAIHWFSHRERRYGGIQ